jgi:hypothetical protein
MPILLEQFFRLDFNFQKFAIDNEELINDEYLKTFVENGCTDIYGLCRDMFADNHMKFSIHKTFPKDKILAALKPYLDLYVVSQFSLNNHKKMRVSRKLHRKLHLFADYNMNFGRRKVQVVTNNPFQASGNCQYYFDEKYLPFPRDEEDGDFMTSHLSAVYSRSIRPIPTFTYESDHDSEYYSDSDNESDGVDTVVDEEQRIIDEPVIRRNSSHRYVIDDEEEEDDENDEEDDVVIQNEEEEDETDINSLD